MKTTNYKRFEELEEKYFGKIGTPERDEYESDLKKEFIESTHESQENKYHRKDAEA